MDPSGVAALLANGRARDAVALARQGAQAHPADGHWLHLLGAALHASGEPVEALARLHEAVRLVPHDPIPWNTLGAVLVEMGDLAGGERALREALRILPAYPEALFNIALALKQGGELEAAQHTLSQLVASSPDFIAARFELANVLVANDDAAAALPMYESLLERFPGDARLLASAAAAHRRLGNREVASALCDQALAQPGIAPPAIATIAYTLAGLGRVVDAKAAARARGIDPARLIFAPYVPQEEHISRLRSADIAVDTFPCSSHTTASDAVWAGVPLVTTYGGTFASRVAASVLSAPGCAEWAFDDAEDAFEATLAMAREPSLRRAARERLDRTRRSSRLFDATTFARDFENLVAAEIEEQRR